MQGVWLKGPHQNILKVVQTVNTLRTVGSLEAKIDRHTQCMQLHALTMFCCTFHLWLCCARPSCKHVGFLDTTFWTMHHWSLHQR